LYSGSPVSLSFSERSDQKRVILIELKNQDLHHTSIPVPVFRNLVKVSGSLAAIKEKLNLHSAQKNALKTLVELELIAKDYDPELVQQFESFVFQFESDTLQIVKHKASFENRISGTNQLFSSEQQIEELQPSQVFSTLLEKENIQDKDRVALRAAFEKIIEELNA
jgi:exonuclease SbcD